MKRIILSSLFLCTLVSVSFSQQDSVLKDKKGRVILPEKGDIAIGIGANSIFNYAGNMFSASGQNRLNLDLLNINQLYGKYFINEKSAIRAKLSISTNSKHEESLVPDYNDYNNYVTDKHDYSSNETNCAIGYERRKGSTRMQLAYGAEFLFSTSASKSDYDYGNKYTNSSYGGSRILSSSNTDGIAVGLNAFAGVEYFILPKMSLGCEVGLGYSKQFSGKNTTEIEKMDYTINEIVVDKNTTKNNSYQVNTHNMGGQLFLLFHF